VLFGCKPKTTTENNALQTDSLPLVENHEINNPSFFDKSISGFQIISGNKQTGYDYQTVEVTYDVLFLILDGHKELVHYIAKYTTTTKTCTGCEGVERNIRVEIYSFEDNSKPVMEIDKNCDKLEIFVDTYKTAIYGCCGAENSYEVFDFRHKSIIQADNQIILGRIPNSNVRFYIGFKQDFADTLHLGTLNFSYNSDERFSVKIRTGRNLENDFFLPFSPDIEILSKDEADAFSKSKNEYTFWSLNKVSNKTAINNLVVRLTFPSQNETINNVIDIPVMNGKPFGKGEQIQEIFIEE
jgi:hypothetical protein